MTGDDWGLSRKIRDDQGQLGRIGDNWERPREIGMVGKDQDR